MALRGQALLVTIAVGLIVAVVWPSIFNDIVVVQNGYGRKIQPISDFPYQCRKISGPGLQACEDMWLSERTRQLFLACSNPLGRKEWMPKWVLVKTK
jgi:hypothetical protein